MSRAPKQSQVVVYQDVLCPWSWLAELRLSQLQRELAAVLRFVPRPYPLRPMESLPSEDEIARAVKDLAGRRAGARVAAAAIQSLDLGRPAAVEHGASRRARGGAAAG